MSDRGKTFDIKGFADGFREALDLPGFAEGIREAFDFRGAARSFAAGFCDGAGLLSGHLRQVGNRLHVAKRHAKTLQGHLQLDQLLADVAGEGGAAPGALNGFRALLRHVHPGADAIPDDHLPALVTPIIRAGLVKPAAWPEEFSGAVALALAEGQAKAEQFAFAEAKQLLEFALYRAEAERKALLAERDRIISLELLIHQALAHEGHLLMRAGSDLAPTKRRGRRRGPE